MDTLKEATVKVARAMASSIYDIENDMVMTSIITRYDAAERDVAIQLIEDLKMKGLKNDLILFDRGYPSNKGFIRLVHLDAFFLYSNLTSKEN